MNLEKNNNSACKVPDNLQSATDSRSEEKPCLQQHSLLKSTALHLFPGILIFLFYILAVPVAQRMGYPSGISLLIAIGLVLIPFEAGILFYHGRKQNGSFSLKGIVLYLEPMPWWQYAALGIPLFLWLGLIFGVVSVPLDKIFIDHYFSWVPDWFYLFGPSNELVNYSKSVLVTTAVLNVIFNGIAGPIVEELYFRGYLLPRLSRLKWLAPLINVLLFSLYHFFTPWQNLTRILALIPLIYIVWWKKNIYIGMIVHCAGNLVGAIGMLVMALGMS